MLDNYTSTMKIRWDPEILATNNGGGEGLSELLIRALEEEKLISSARARDLINKNGDN